MTTKISFMKASSPIFEIEEHTQSSLTKTHFTTSFHSVQWIRTEKFTIFGSHSNVYLVENLTKKTIQICFESETNTTLKLALNQAQTVLIVAEVCGYLHFIHLDTGLEFLRKDLSKWISDIQIQSLEFSSYHLTEPNKTNHASITTNLNGESLTELMNESLVLVSQYHVLVLKNLFFDFPQSFSSVEDAKKIEEQIENKVRYELLSFHETSPSFTHHASVSYALLNTSPPSPFSSSPRSNAHSMYIFGQGRFIVSQWSHSDTPLSSKFENGILMQAHSPKETNLSILKAQWSPQTDYFYTLDSKRRLYQWLPTFLYSCRQFNETIADFSITHRGIAVLNEHRTVWKLVHFQTLHILASFSVDLLDSIPASPKTNTNTNTNINSNLYLVETFSQTDHFFISHCSYDEALKVEKWHLIELSEADPDQRIPYLLLKKEWSEALEVVKQANLSLDIVYKAQLNQWKNTLVSFSTIHSLLLQLSTIDLKINYCLWLRYLTQEDVSSCLDFAYTSLLTSPSCSSSLKKKLKETMNRWGSWQLLGWPYQPDAWNGFLVHDLVTLTKKIASEGASLWQLECLYHRHEDIKLNIDQILPCVPNLIDQHASLVQFLKTSILPLSSPSVRSKLSPWLLNYVLEVEKTKDASSALQVVELLCDPSLILNDSFQPIRYLSDTSFHLLDPDAFRLAQRLSDLIYLSEKHGYDLSLENYLQLTPTKIAFDLLDRVQAPELLPNVITTHLFKYCERFELNPTQLLTSYTLHIVNDSTLFSATWETRILILLGQLKNVQFQCDVALELIPRLPIPCSNEMQDYLQSMLNKEDQLLRYAELVNQFRSMKLRHILYKHKIPRTFDVSHTRQATNLVKYLTTLEDGLDDALCVAESFNFLTKHFVFYEYFLHQYSKQPSTQFYSFLKSLFNTYPSKKDLFQPAFHVVASEFHAFDEVYSSSNLVLKAQNLISLIDFLRLLDSRDTQPLLFEKEKQALFMVCRLAEEFQLYAFINDVYETQNKVAFFTQHQANFTSSRLQKKRLATILGIDTFTAQYISIQLALSTSNTEEAVRLTCEWFEDVSANLEESQISHVLISMAKLLSTFKSISPIHLSSRWIQSFFKLSQTCVYHADKASIVEAIELFKLAFLLKYIFARCEAGDYQNTISKPQSSLTSLSLKSASHYRPFSFTYDTGLVLDTKSALSKTLEILSQHSHLFFSPSSFVSDPNASVSSNKGKEKEDFPPFLSSCLGLIQLLNDAKHYQLSLTFQMMLTSSYLDPNLQLTKKVSKALILTDPEQTIIHACNELFQAPIIDQELSFNCLIALEPQVSFQLISDWIKFVHPDFTNVASLCDVGCNLGEFLGQRQATEKYEEYQVKVRWWSQFHLLSIPFQTHHFEPGHERDQLLLSYIPMLLDKTRFDLSTALDFASDFNLNEDLILLKFIEEQLNSNLDPTSAFNLIASVHQDIARKDQLFSLYEKAFLSTNPYDYTRLRFLLDQILDLTKNTSLPFEEANETFLLYSRVLNVIEKFEKPYTSKIDEELQQAQKHEWLPLSLVEKRLNLHTLVQQGWDYIFPFLDETTLPVLLPLAIPLQFSMDAMYSQIILKCISSSALLDRPLPSFSHLRTYLKHVQSSDMGAAICIAMAEKFQGEDRLKAYQMAMSYTEKEVFMSGEANATQQLERLQQFIFQTQLEIILTKHGLPFSDYSLNNDPKKLICCFYTDSILLRWKTPSLNIHQITLEISNMSDLDIHAIRKELLHQLLEGKNESQTLPLDRLPSFILYQPNVIFDSIIPYLLDTFDRSETISLLLEIAFNQSVFSTVKQIHAIHVLLKYATIDELKQNKKSIAQLRTILKVYCHFHDFDYLRISINTRDILESTSSVAQSLWMHHRDDVRCIQLICNLYLDFKIGDSELLENALESLIEHQQFTYLISILTPLTRNLVNSCNFVKVWKHFLLVYALKANINSDLLLDFLHCLKSCLYLFQLSSDTSFMNTLCESLKSHSNLLKLQFISCFPLTLEQIRSVLISLNLDLEELVSLSHVLPSQHPFLDFLFTQCHQLQKYTSLINTPHVIPAFSFFQKQGWLSSIVRFLLENAEHGIANQIVEFYFQSKDLDTPSCDEDAMNMFFNLESKADTNIM